MIDMKWIYKKRNELRPRCKNPLAEEDLQCHWCEGIIPQGDEHQIFHSLDDGDPLGVVHLGKCSKDAFDTAHDKKLGSIMAKW